MWKQRLTFQIFPQECICFAAVTELLKSSENKYEQQRMNKLCKIYINENKILNNFTKN
jgi:hypothetical protein